MFPSVEAVNCTIRKGHLPRINRAVRPVEFVNNCWA